MGRWYWNLCFVAQPMGEGWNDVLNFYLGIFPETVGGLNFAVMLVECSASISASALPNEGTNWRDHDNCCTLVFVLICLLPWGSLSVCGWVLLFSNRYALCHQNHLYCSCTSCCCMLLSVSHHSSTFQDRTGQGTPTCSDGYLKLYIIGSISSKRETRLFGESRRASWIETNVYIHRDRDLLIN